MLNLLNYNAPLTVNGQLFANSTEAYEAFKNHKGQLEIKLNVKGSPAPVQQAEKATKAPSAPANVPVATTAVYRIEVRQYMTKKAAPDFDFMKKYNDDAPMPMRRMYGEILEETKGMYKMKLHGRAEKNASHCSHCMRGLTHPVSVYYGIGPICGEHMHMAPMKVLEQIADEEALFKQADEALRAITWVGWIPKKAIESMREVETVKKEVAV